MIIQKMENTHIIEEFKKQFKFKTITSEEWEKQPKELKNNKESIIQLIHEQFNIYPYLEYSLRNDEELVRKHLITIPLYDIIKFTTFSIKNDPDLMKIALKYHSDNFEYIGQKLKNNEKFILECLIDMPYLSQSVIYFAKNTVFKSKEIASLCVSHDGLLLRQLPEQFKNDIDIVSTALKQNGLALEFASEQWRNNKEIVLEVVKNIGNAFEFSSDELKNDYELVLTAVSKNGNMLQYASDELKNNKEIVFAAINEHFEAINFVGKELKKEYDVALFIIKRVGSVLTNKLIDPELSAEIKNFGENHEDQVAYLERKCYEKRVTELKDKIDSMVPNKEEFKKKIKI